MLQTHYQNLTQTTSAHLAQTMTLLSLTNTELQQKVDSELANNPALELTNVFLCPMCKKPLPPSGICPICSQPKNLNTEEPIVFISAREDFYTKSSLQYDEINADPFSPEVLDLPSFVLQQIGPDLSYPERLIAAYILTHLDDDGFLTITALEIARYHHKLPSEIQELIHKLQFCEPIGVCSANPKEAMLIQIEALGDKCVLPELTKTVISEGLDYLSHHRYSELAQKIGVTTHQIEIVSKFISENLNPFPAHAHWGDVRNPNEEPDQVYHQPDILMYHLNDDPEKPLVVEIISPIRGTLRINPLFKNALKSIEGDKVEEWKSDLEKASLLIKCIQQRGNTLRILLEKLVRMQCDFIINGEKSSKSLTRAEIAEQLNVHESTISRAVAGKTVQLPNRRIIPLSMFFDRSLAYRSMVKEIIEQEDHPYSDTEIQKKLLKKGVKIARRTVAKYRAMEGILPAHLRQTQEMGTASG